MTYYSKTDWQSENETIADGLWDGLNMDSITVAISKDWAAEHGLPPSAPFYWDADKALYHVKGIHGMHCLVRTTVHSPLKRMAYRWTSITLTESHL
jgi:hypothetical protein